MKDYVQSQQRNVRPLFHFTPPEMWMNDPNGMVFENGNYHLYYQHHPFSCVPGPMHWGHAVTRDLIHWQHKPIAIYPDELGVIFSGSCVYDKENSSGFGTKENPPIIAMFTSHGKTEQQSIAYSVDGGNHFEKYYGNPVIQNTQLPDFRDPKIFWNPVFHCWSVIIAAGDRVHFYKSENLRDWEKTGEFGAAENPMPGIWECPDMLQMEINGKTTWVVISNMIAKDRDIPHRTQYFIGDFDGNTFIDTQKSTEPLLLDYGLDNYAGVTFQNASPPVLMGWAMNWAYAETAPTGSNYRGQMTLARELCLQYTAQGLRLAQKPMGLAGYRESACPVSEKTVLGSNCFGLLLSAQPGSRVRLSNETGEEVCLHITETQIILDRSKAGENDFHKSFLLPDSQKAVAPRTAAGKVELELVLDMSLVEVFAEGGLCAISSTIYPQHPYTLLEILGEAEGKLYSMDLYAGEKE